MVNILCLVAPCYVEAALFNLKGCDDNNDRLAFSVAPAWRVGAAALLTFSTVVGARAVTLALSGSIHLLFWRAFCLLTRHCARPL